MSHSLIVPRHLAEQRRAAMADPGVEVKQRPEGMLPFDDAWFEQEKARIIAECGAPLEKMRVTLNHVLVAIFRRPSTRPVEGGKSIILPDSYTDEDIYQGNAGLVIKLGGRCFEDSSTLTWTDADRFAVGDWVLFRRGDRGGFRLRVNGVECIHFEDERGVKAVVPRPDVIY